MRVLSLLALLILVRPLAAAVLTDETVRGWNDYVASAQQVAAQREKRDAFLWAAENPGQAARVRSGEVVVAEFGREQDRELKDGIVHDWIGAAFLPHARLDDVVAIIRDYGNHEKIFAPEVVASEILSEDGDRLHVRLRLVKKKVLTATLETEHRVVIEKVSETRRRLRSESVRVQEVENAGEANEKLKPAGDDNGFLWRMNVEWRFEQAEDGVMVECRAISLSRKPPAGLGWIVNPIIASLPRESLTKTMEATRRAWRARTRG